MRLVLAIPVVLMAAGAPAQDAGFAFGPFRQDAKDPVEVTAERLQVDQGGGTAVFSGDVVVVQGQMQLTAPEVRVDYAGSGEPGGIRAMHASGGVTLVNGEDAAEGREATYSVEDGTLILTGDVIVTQGSAVLAGQRLFVDLDAGTGTMEGRVRTIFRADDG